MSYYESFCRLLSPLHAYELREDSISGAELSAAGQALDTLYAEAKTALREAIPATACDEGLAAYRKLAAYLCGGATAEALRENLRILLEKRPHTWTLAQAQQSAQCILRCTVEEDGAPNKLVVRYTASGRLPSAVQTAVRLVLPAQAEVRFAQAETA